MPVVSAVRALKPRPVFQPVVTAARLASAPGPTARLPPVASLEGCERPLLPPSLKPLFTVVALKKGEVTEVPMVGAAVKDGAPALATSTVLAPPCAVTCTDPVLLP